jgi:hypothetical protein
MARAKIAKTNTLINNEMSWLKDNKANAAKLKLKPCYSTKTNLFSLLVFCITTLATYELSPCTFLFDSVC